MVLAVAGLLGGCAWFEPKHELVCGATVQGNDVVCLPLAQVRPVTHSLQRCVPVAQCQVREGRCELKGDEVFDRCMTCFRSCRGKGATDYTAASCEQSCVLSVFGRIHTP